MADKKDLFEDISKLAGSMADTAVHSLVDLKKQVAESAKHKVADLLEKTDLIQREEFEVLKKMLQKMKLENEQLNKRLAHIEKKLKKKSLKNKKNIKDIIN